MDHPCLTAKSALQKGQKIMSNFKEFLQYKALAFKYSTQNLELTEQLLAQGGEGVEALPLRNVCAKLSVELAENIDQVCSTLGISKRLFIQNAMIEACAQANQALQDVNAFEWIDAQEQK